MPPRPWIESDPESPESLRAGGDWRIDTAGELSALVRRVRGPANSVDTGSVTRMDAAGALLLLKLARRLAIDEARLGLSDEHRALVDAVIGARDEDSTGQVSVENRWHAVLAHIGVAVADTGGNLTRLLGFLGLTLTTLATVIFRPSRWRITSTVHHMQQTGFDALPLVALLSFLVGAVIAFLGATVLRAFGAELFVVDLTTYAFLREFGVLLTAILLAGRTASAFTAQIGTMKSREEIDAIRTLGLDPVELLVLPRLVALLIMLPILTVIAMLAGLVGGLMVAVFSLGITPELFWTRAYESVELRHYLVGLIKAPLFAMVIALVGCLEGFKVIGTAQSVGERTTSAVVQSISLVIIIDALAAVFFMEIGW